jgi:hypothetical protein
VGTVVLDNVAISNLIYDPGGPIAREMNRVAQFSLLPIAQAALSRPWPGKGSAPFPPPGPPYLRTGDLRDSLRVVDGVGPSGPEATIVPTALHRGVNYGEILMKRGYRFLPDYYYV